MMIKRHDDSHVHDGVTPRHLEWVLMMIGDINAGSDGLVKRTLVLPEELDGVPCELHGPIMGDEPIPDAECVMALRTPRMYESRFTSRLPRLVRQISVIAGPHAGEPLVLYTIHGGPIAPREVGDPALATASNDERQHSRDFWGRHALSIITYDVAEKLKSKYGPEHARAELARKATQAKMEKSARGLGEAIVLALAKSRSEDPTMPEVGFALLLFDIGPDGSSTYLSNVERDDMIASLEELLVRMKEEKR